MDFIAGLQDITKKTAEANAAKKESDTKKPGEQGGESADGKDGKKEGSSASGSEATKNSPGEDGGMTLSKFFKDKHGIELSDDEILAKVKSTEGKEGNGGRGSAGTLKEPTLEDVSEDEIGSFLETNGNRRSVLERSKANATKENLSLVKEHYLAQLKAHEDFKGLQDEQLESLFNERYFISDDPTAYTAEEQKLGKMMLEQEATRLKGSDSLVVEQAKKLLHQQKLQVYSQQLMSQEVDEFMSKQPKKLVYEFGKSGQTDLGNYEMELLPESLTSITAIMKEPLLLLNEFKGEDGNIDLGKFYNFLVDAKLSGVMRKSIASFYHSKGLGILEDKLHNNPDLSGGSGNKNANEKTKQTQEAIDHNKAQIEQNTGRQPKRR